MTFKAAPRNLSITIRNGALRSIFDECDRYDADETGGRLLGVYRGGWKEGLKIELGGVIEPGPKARRSSTSFFQDGAYQADVFRRLEERHPEIEHLGNWHTHHVNGYPALSGGDIETYRRTVNHPKHNLDFFYALLVVAKGPGRDALQRYSVRHYVLFRGDSYVYEVPEAQIAHSDEAIIWPHETREAMTPPSAPRDNSVRVKDQAILGELFPGFRAQLSKKADTFFWKGELGLIDGAVVPVMAAETEEADSGGRYQLFVKDAPKACAKAVDELLESRFGTATQALRAAELALNKALFEEAFARNRKRPWSF